MAVLFSYITYSIAHFSPSAVEHRHDLGTGAVVLRQEAIVVALEHARVDDPVHHLERVGGNGVEVVELADRHAAPRRVHSLRLGKAVEHRRDLLARNEVVRAEAAGEKCTASVPVTMPPSAAQRTAS